MIPHKERVEIRGKWQMVWLYRANGNLYVDKYLDSCLRNADYYRRKKA